MQFITVVLNQDDLGSHDTFGNIETIFCYSSWRVEYYWHLEGGDQGCCWTSYKA